MEHGAVLKGPDRFRRVHAEGLLRRVEKTVPDGAAVMHETEPGLAVPFEFTGAGDAEVSMRGVTLAGPCSGTVGPRLDHEVLWIADGQASITDERGVVIHAEVGHPVILSASNEYRFTADASKLTLVHVSDALIQRIAATRAITLHGPIVFEQQDDLVAALAPFRTLIRAVGPQILNPGLTRATRTAVNARVAAAVLDAFPLRNPFGGTGDRFRDVIAFVHDHVHGDIDAGAIAEAAGMSSRGTEQMFRRVLNTTPMRYVRRVRLDRVRADLLTAEPRTTTVGDVARRWGVGHIGRFSAEYRDQFGEYPAATLRRGPDHPDRPAVSDNQM